jgi:alkylhydroperoxidase family enzyme
VPRFGDSPDAVRGRVPDALDRYRETRETVLRGGIVDAGLKELCARFLADEPIELGALGERERAALEWAEAIAFDSDRADDALWERLRAAFTEPELVELGYAIAFTLGQQHWLRTLGFAPEIPQADAS